MKYLYHHYHVTFLRKSNCVLGFVTSFVAIKSGCNFTMQLVIKTLTVIAGLH